MDESKIQYISPHIRVYSVNMLEFVENKYPCSKEFINKNKTTIDGYILKNLKEYVCDPEILKK